MKKNIKYNKNERNIKIGNSIKEKRVKTNGFVSNESFEVFFPIFKFNERKSYF